MYHLSIKYYYFRYEISLFSWERGGLMPYVSFLLATPSLPPTFFLPSISPILCFFANACPAHPHAFTFKNPACLLANRRNELGSLHHCVQPVDRFKERLSKLFDLVHKVEWANFGEVRSDLFLICHFAIHLQDQVRGNFDQIFKEKLEILITRTNLLLHVILQYVIQDSSFHLIGPFTQQKTQNEQLYHVYFVQLLIIPQNWMIKYGEQNWVFVLQIYPRRIIFESIPQLSHRDSFSVFHVDKAFHTTLKLIDTHAIKRHCVFKFLNGAKSLQNSLIFNFKFGGTMSGRLPKNCLLTTAHWFLLFMI